MCNLCSYICVYALCICAFKSHTMAIARDNFKPIVTVIAWEK